MANKLRPKKVKAPYRKYIGGVGFVRVQGFGPGSGSIGDTTHGRGDGEDGDTSVLEEFEEGPDIHLTSYGRLKSRRRSQRNSISKSSEKILESMMILSIDSDPMTLPYEVQMIILGYCEKIEPQFLLVCKMWYWMCIPKLYKSPKLHARNFNKFVDSIIENKKRKFGEYVLDLDLSTILQSGKNSFVSKLLRRCSPALESFIAPQTSFGYAPLVSLKACHNLRYLDLGLVSETVKLKELFSAISNFKHLTHLSFPRSSIDCEGFREFVWPSNLEYVKLSGGITNEFVRETEWPRTISTLEFSFCPKVNEHSIYTVLSKIGDNLSTLRFHYPMPALKDNSLDYVFRYCSHLTSIQLVVDYCSKWIFSEHLLSPLIFPRPLQTIYLDCSGSLGLSSKIHPDDFTIAIMELRLPQLKHISISSRLGWNINSNDVQDLLCACEDQGGALYIKY